MSSEIKNVGKCLKNAVKNNNSVLQETAFHLLSSGGKRVRPAFVLLSSQFGPEKITEDMYHVVVASELIHMATLVHDDVIDRSNKRRGKLTTEERRDVTTTILTGNFLLTLGLKQLSKIEDHHAHTIISDVIVDVCRGELFQFQDQFNSHQNIMNYLRRINRKTALLIQLPTETDTITSQADNGTVRKLRMIGHYIGMSFRIVDDILDFASTERKLGKPVGSNLMNSRITLPVLLEMKKDSVFKKQIVELSHLTNKHQFDPLIGQIRNSNSITQSQEVSDHYLNKTLDLVDQLEEPNSQNLFRKFIKRMCSRNT